MYGSMESYVPSAEVREKTTLADGNWFQKFPRNAVFYLASRNPPVVQLELISVYSDSCENSWSSLLLMIRGDVASLCCSCFLAGEGCRGSPGRPEFESEARMGWGWRWQDLV